MIEETSVASPLLSPKSPGTRLHLRSEDRPTFRPSHLVVLFASVVATCAFIAWANPSSLLAYGYFFAAWTTVLFVFDRGEIKRFGVAFIITALLAAGYVAVQSYACPESYGTTTPGGSQTDDSFFFSLVADAIPPGMETRKDYELYPHNYTDLLKAITPFPILRPLDIIFFNAGIAGLLCIWTRKLAILVTHQEKVGRTAYWLCLFSPLLLMNGGAILIRETLVAALFVLTLDSLLRARYLIVVGCIALQFWLRPGTALLLMPLYPCVFWPTVVHALRRQKINHRMGVCLAVGVLAIAGLLFFRADLLELLESKSISLFGLKRTGLEEYVSDGGRGGAFAAIQDTPIYLRALLSTVFMWLIPFYYPEGTFGDQGFDLRNLLLSVVYPFWIFFSHAWVFALFLSKARSRLSGLILTFFSACLFIGMISLESRHRNIVQPIYYIIAAAGCCLANQRARLAGYFLSATWLVIQVVYYYLHAR